MSVAARSTEYGRIGLFLANLIRCHPEWCDGWNSDGLVADMVKVQRLMVPGPQFDEATAAAGSLLLLDFPMQLDISKHCWERIWKSAFDLPMLASDFPGPSLDTLSLGFPLSPGGLARWLSVSENFYSVFPRKGLLMGEYKLNVSPPALVASFLRCYGAGLLFPLLRATAGRITDDRLCGLLLYALTLRDSYGELGVSLAIHLTLYPDDAKALNTASKALGLNSQPWGCVLCEAQTLAGRFFGTLDLAAETKLRTEPSHVAKGLVGFSADELRPHVRALLSSELSRDVRLPDLQDFWSRRWLWCVNGSHTTKSSEAMGIPPDFLSKTHTRVYRRAAAETAKSEPLTDWDGRVFVSPSSKLEHGKTRAIFACDTRSYFAFSWILETVQQKWRNKRILLDPGSGGHLGIARRISKAQRGGGVNLMLDYDDFNSQHSNDVMAMVFEELCAHINAPSWYRDKLAASFHSTLLPVDGGWVRSAGTLMSGHRATTFINSVLNAAYVRASMGASSFDTSFSLHAGDDVFFRCDTPNNCVSILTSARARGCRMNPTKQSIGFKGAEFLRVAVRGDACYGYVARSIASFVSGNWTTEGVPTPRDALQSAITGCRSMINRGCNPSVCEIIAPALRHVRGVKVRLLSRLLKGEWALEGAPVFGGSGLIHTVTVAGGTLPDRPIDNNWAKYATTAYLNHHCTDLETAAIQLARADVVSLMVASSYSKGLDHRDDTGAFEPLELAESVPVRPVGYADASILCETKTETGLLAAYPLLQLVKNGLTSRDIQALLLMAGYSAPIERAREIAFGAESRSKRILGVLSSADASMLSRRTSAGHIWTAFSCHV
ncbi:MAG: RNA-dependent RNA polymerase [Hangzhou totivirus 4]|nr:MAG: RNA-dependent RNA polymerase [Hangzhou totivirus 4]